MNSDEQGTDCYRIGAVSRLTGLSVHTLRVWESRNRAIKPSRSSKGTRLYSAEDVERLLLMKQLIDAGDAISIIANLPLASLKDRADSMEKSEAKIANLTPDVKCSLYIVGEAIAMRLSREINDHPEITIIGSSESPEGYSDIEISFRPNILIIEMPNLFEDESIDLLKRWLRVTGAEHAIIMYRFASQKAIDQLDNSMYTLLKAPLTTNTILHYCKAMTYSKPQDLPYQFSSSPPERRFNDSALAKLASQSSTVQCECPRHLAELVSCLAAFESYSAQCENRNVEDAALHAYLKNVTAHARDAIELAITEVLKTEGISLSDK